jgi:chemotaxis protein histidine kinase CheA
MLQLEAVSWAEQTCYYSGLSEDTLKWEMKQRNQQQTPPWFKEDEYHYYHPRHAFTQTDYLMTIYAEGQDTALRKKHLSIHPDKLAPELKAIAEYCSDKVDKQRKRYIHVARAWYAGQWFAPPPSPEGEAASLEPSFSHRYGAPQEFRQQEPTLIEKPEAPLGFGIARLHQAYLNWANGQPSLVKSTRGSLGLQHSLYEGDGDEKNINRQMDMRRDFLRDEREKLRLQAETKKLEAKREEIRAERAALRQKEKEAIDAAKQAAAARKEAETRATQEAARAAQEAARAMQEAARATQEAARAGQAESRAEKAEQKMDAWNRKSLMKKLCKNLDTLIPLSSKEIEVRLQAICAEMAGDWGEPLEYAEKLLSTLLAEEPQLAALRQKLKPSAVSVAGLFSMSKTENKNNGEPTQENSLSH